MTDQKKPEPYERLPKIPEAARQPKDSLILPQDQVCAIIQDLLPLYSEGLESAETKRFIEEHLPDCPQCRKALELLRDPVPAAAENEPVMEAALQKVNHRFRWNKTIVITLSVICLVLAGLGGWATLKSMRLSGSDLNLALFTGRDDQTRALITYYGGPLLFTSTSEKSDGVYEIDVYGWSTDSADHHSVKEVNLEKPIEEIRVNGCLMYQDGVLITTRCRELFQNANGYAGSTYQMSLSRPDLFAMSFHIEADTENPEACTWSWICDEPADRQPDPNLLSVYKENALILLALTPNLAKIQLLSSDSKPYLVVAREDLNEILKKSGLSANVETPADLQKILNAVSGAGR